VRRAWPGHRRRDQAGRRRHRRGCRIHDGRRRRCVPVLVSDAGARALRASAPRVRTPARTCRGLRAADDPGDGQATGGVPRRGGLRRGVPALVRRGGAPDPGPLRSHAGGHRAEDRRPASGRSVLPAHPVSLPAGCTVVIKPAGLTPLTTLAFAQLLEEVGLPAGVVNVLTTTSSRGVSEAILPDERLRKLSFTGSTPVGQALLKQAAPGILRTSMELGGNAPFVIFEDADLDKAVEGAMAAKFRNVGQACTAANRFIVHRSVAEEFTRRVTEKVKAMQVGRGTEDGVAIGPLIDDRAVHKASSLVSDALDRGATLQAGGAALEGEGSFYQPTVVADVPEGSEILREEIFGPVLAIVPFDDEDEAVRLANNTEYGLVSYVYTENLSRGQRMIDRLATGMMGLNVGVVSNAAAPFGGWKFSGIGREGGAEGIHEYLQTKYTLTPNPYR